MATRSISVQAATPQDLETMTMSYIAQGFSVANKTPMQVTLIKRKEFSVLWAVIGFIICLLPLLIYLIIYASESDQMVVITVAGAPQVASTVPLVGATQPAAYLNAPRSPDGYYWWDGQAWQPIPQTGPMPQQPPTGPMQPYDPYGQGQQPPTGPVQYPNPYGQTGPMN